MAAEQSEELTYQQIREKIMQGAMDVNTRYPGSADDPSILQVAIKEQDTELIDYLLQNKADVNIVSETCEPALNLAIRANNPELVKKIIPLVADLNVRLYDYGEDYQKWPKYTLMVKKMHDMDYEMMAQCGHPGKAPPKPKGTALELAITVGSIEIIDMLLAAGASIDPTNGIKPLHWSIALNKCEITEYLIKRGADINALSYHENPMHVAAEKGHKEIVELLINHKANIDGINNAIENHHFEIAKLLLDAGAELNPTKSCPPLFAAVTANSCEFVEYLINRGANVDIQYNGKTAVHLAVLGNNQEMLELLIKHKATLNVSTLNNTAIHAAIDRGHLHLLKILLKAGADLHAPTHVDTVSNFALRYHKLHIFDFFLDIGVDFKKDSYLDLINAGLCTDELQNKIKHHIVKLKVANFFVEPKNLQFIEDESFNEFYYECFAEIELMKITKIDGTGISYYDVVHKTKQELAADLKSLSEKIGVTESELRAKFPLYGGWICYRLEYEQGKNLSGANDGH